MILVIFKLLLNSMAKSDKNSKKGRCPEIRNKKAFRDYEIIEKIEAGIVLTGSEVKSLRSGKGDLSGSYGRINGTDFFLVGANISVYENAGYTTHEPDRERKLLVHKSQILKLQQRTDQKGFTLVPLRIYFNDRGYAKVEIAVARGRKKYDNRDKMVEKQFKKEMRF